jgi:hypothetical protein
MSDKPPSQFANAIKDQDWPRLAARIAFAAFLLSLLAGMLVPIYTDEIGWRMQERAAIDGGVDRMYNDICGPNSIAVPPIMMMPARYFSGWLNSAFPDPLYVRTVGVLCAAIWAFLFRGLIGRIAKDNQQRNLLTAVAFGLLGLGLLPWFMVMSRPEHPILLTSAVAMLIAATASGRTGIWTRYAWVWPLLIVGLAVVAMSYHMKGILFLPLFLLCIFFCGDGKKSLFLRIAAMVLLTGLALVATRYWVDRFSCPGDPELALRLAQQNIMSVVAAGGDWSSLVSHMIRGANPNEYIVIAEARPYPLSAWLPIKLTSGNAALARFIPTVLAWNLALGIALICLFKALRSNWREKRLAVVPAIAAVCAGMVLVWGMSQLHKNSYEAATILPLLTLFTVFALASVPWTAQRTRQLSLAVFGLVAFSIVAQLDIAARYGPELLRRAAQPGYLKEQHTSASVYGYSRIRQNIVDTARMCGIGANGRAVHPMIDDVTYFAMADSYQPFHRLGVLLEWNGTIRDPMAYLKSRGSEGMIVGCRFLVPKLRVQAKRNGEFCCISTR